MAYFTPSMKTLQLCLRALSLLWLCSHPHVWSFTMWPQRVAIQVFRTLPTSIPPALVHQVRNGRTLRDASVPFFIKEVVSNEPETLKDNKGKSIAAGSVVRVAVEGLKAFQINPKGQGSYNSKKQFVPADNKTEENSKYLLVPVGLRGTVTKIYDTDQVSANFPIQVKFEPGKHVEEGYDAPTAFLMHFVPGEIEVV